MILVLSLSVVTWFAVFFIKFFTFLAPGPSLSMPPSLQPAQAVITDPTRKGGTLVHLLCISLGWDRAR